MARPDIRSPILVGRASQVVAAELRARILLGDLGEGGRLPSEAEFAAQLGISRHRMREALRLLEQDGLLEIRNGPTGGVFLTTPDAGVLARTVQGILARRKTPISDVLAVRTVLEVAAAEFAAQQATEADLAGLASICERQQEPDGDWRDAEHNTAFHEQLARAAHNQTLLLTLQAHAAITPSSETIGPRPRLQRESSEAHREILRALQARDAERAGALMRRHLLQTVEQLREAGFDPSALTVADAIRLARNSAR